MAEIIPGTSKLAKRQKGEPAESLDLVHPSNKTYQKNYRLYAEDLKDLREVQKRCARLQAKGKVTETAVIRMLIQLGMQVSDKQLYKAYRDSL